MTDKIAFEAAMRSHLSSCRQKTPVPPRESLSPLEEAQCQVLGGHLLRWLTDWGPALLQQRAVFSKLQGWEPDPVVCFHSVMPGLVAAREILPDDAGRIVCGLPIDFESAPIRDDEFVFHVEIHSLFSLVVPAEVTPEVRSRYPLAEREDCFLHRDESVLGPVFARGANHLWKWNGQELILLEEAIETWVS